MSEELKTDVILGIIKAISKDKEIPSDEVTWKEISWRLVEVNKELQEEVEQTSDDVESMRVQSLLVKEENESLKDLLVDSHCVYRETSKSGIEWQRKYEELLKTKEL